MPTTNELIKMTRYCESASRRIRNDAKALGIITDNHQNILLMVKENVKKALAVEVSSKC